jgi:hypothetical protein
MPTDSHSGGANEFITESLSLVSDLPTIIQKSLKSIEHLEKLCIKLSKRISFLSNERKTKDHDKLEEIEYLKLLCENLYEKKINIITSNTHMIDQHVSNQATV